MGPDASGDGTCKVRGKSEVPRASMQLKGRWSPLWEDKVGEKPGQDNGILRVCPDTEHARTV